MKYTEEQMACIQSDAPSLSINAFAGTGKTSTLVGRAEARKKEKILYIAFNRSMAEDASKRFPENVVCKSSHSLAFAPIVCTSSQAPLFVGVLVPVQDAPAPMPTWVKSWVAPSPDAAPLPVHEPRDAAMTISQ